tara:strand:+ start:10283 stop:12787 length:2505 start_codon:yes stop_codon:yes gene_type:complete
MEIEELISKKDKILNELFEIFDFSATGNLEDLTPSQLYRQKALKQFLENNWHHMDLEESFNNAMEIQQKGNESLLKEKIINYYRDVNELNKTEGKQVLPISTKYEVILNSPDGIDGLIKFIDDAEDFNTLSYEFAQIIENVNRQELYNGIRHVMPESIEMRMLINYGEEYIDMLETLNRPSFDTNKFADLSYNRIPLSPERLNELGIKNPYIAPNNIAELKEIHQRFLEEFPKKAKEFVLGQSIYLDFNNRDAILSNDEYYQYTGMATSSGDMPSIQMSDNISAIFDKFLNDARADYMYEKSQLYGFEDANEWFEAVLQEGPDNGPDTILWDKATKEFDEFRYQNVVDKINDYFTNPVVNDAFPDEIGFGMGSVSSNNPIYQAVNNPLDPNIGITVIETTTNVADDVNTLDIENYKPITIEVLDDAGLHARPAGNLVSSLSKQNIPLIILEDGNLREVGVIGLLRQQKRTGETLDIYIPTGADINLDEVGGLKVVPTNVVDKGRLVWGSEEFIDAILDEMKDTALNTEFDMDFETGDIAAIRKKQPDVAELIENGKINIGNHNNLIDGLVRVIDRTDLPPGMTPEGLASVIMTNIDEAQNIQRANNPKIPFVGITDTQAQDPEFKKLLTQQFADTPTNVVDDINNKAINQAGEVIDVADDTTTNLSNIVGEGGYNRFTRVLREAPEIVSNIFDNTKKVVSKAFGIGGRIAQVADPGDIIIEQSLVRMLPRLGAGAIAVPALIAYTAYELTILLADVGQALNKARVNQGLGTVAESGGAIFEGLPPFGDADWKQLGRDTWEEMGEISDTWSLSWKISEPIIESVFKQSASMSQEK